MAFGKYWCGNVFGTSTGKVFINIEGSDASLSGKLHFNDTDHGGLVFSVKGEYDGSRLHLEGTSTALPPGVIGGNIFLDAFINRQGHLEGKWESSNNGAGVFLLFPHDRASRVAGEKAMLEVDQLHNVRHDFGAVGIYKDAIVAIADEVQKDFSSPVVIYVEMGTGQGMLLEDYKKRKFDGGKANLVRIFAQEPEVSGLNRVVTIEFGPVVNYAQVQSSKESFSLGKMEQIKKKVQNYEKVYATRIRKLGIGINQVLLFLMIIYLPSLGELWARSVLAGVVVAMIAMVAFVHARFLPHAAIYMGDRPSGSAWWSSPTAVSWGVSATAGLVSTIAAALLQQWMSILSN